MAQVLRNTRFGGVRPVRHGHNYISPIGHGHNYISPIGHGFEGNRRVIGAKGPDGDGGLWPHLRSWLCPSGSVCLAVPVSLIPHDPIHFHFIEPNCRISNRSQTRNLDGPKPKTSKPQRSSHDYIGHNYIMNLKPQTRKAKP